MWGGTRLLDEELQGLPANPRNSEESLEQILPRNPRKEPTLPTP